jgi:Na+/phosphate symporter
MYIAISLIVCLIGLAMFIMSVKPKTQRIGEIMFFCGLFVFLMQIGPAVSSLLPSGMSGRRPGFLFLF